jgi:hypothetical protein
MVIMRSLHRFFIVVAEAALIVTSGWFALVGTVILVRLKPEQAGVAGEVFVAIAFLFPIGAAGWWMFRKLQSLYPRSEARAAAITFVAFTPVTLFISIMLGQIFGGYTGLLLGDRFSFFGAFAGIIVLITLLSFFACSFSMWVMRRISGVGYHVEQ